MSGKSDELVLSRFSLEEITESDNKRIQDLLKKFTDQSLLDRISSYRETHSKWEDNSAW